MQPSGGLVRQRRTPSRPAALMAPSPTPKRLDVTPVHIAAFSPSAASNVSSAAAAAVDALAAPNDHTTSDATAAIRNPPSDDWVHLNRCVATGTHGVAVGALTLDDVSLSGSQWQWLFRVIPLLSALRELTLTNLGLTDDMCNQLFSTVKVLREGGVASAAGSLTAAAPQLVLLDLSGNALTSRSVNALGKCVLSHSSSLETLGLRSNRLRDHGAQLLSVFLRKLGFPSRAQPASKTNAKSKVPFGDLPALRVLDVASNGITPRGVAELMLSAGSVPQLAVLSAEQEAPSTSSNLHKSSDQSGCHNSSAVEGLSRTGSFFGTKPFNNMMTPAEARFHRQWEERMLPPIAAVKSEQTAVSDRHVILPHQIFDGLRTRSTIVALNLSGCKLGSCDSASQRHLMQVIWATCATLRELNVSANALDDEFCGTVYECAGADVLASTQLEVIDLSANRITDDGARALACCAEQFGLWCKSLLWISVADNLLTIDGCLALAAACTPYMSEADSLGARQKMYWQHVTELQLHDNSSAQSPDGSPDAKTEVLARLHALHSVAVHANDGAAVTFPLATDRGASAYTQRTLPRIDNEAALLRSHEILAAFWDRHAGDYAKHMREPLFANRHRLAVQRALRAEMVAASAAANEDHVGPASLFEDGVVPPSVGHNVSTGESPRRGVPSPQHRALVALAVRTSEPDSEPGPEPAPAAAKPVKTKRAKRPVHRPPSVDEATVTDPVAELGPLPNVGGTHATPQTEAPRQLDDVAAEELIADVVAAPVPPESAVNATATSLTQPPDVRIDPPAAAGRTHDPVPQQSTASPNGASSLLCELRRRSPGARFKSHSFRIPHMKDHILTHAWYLRLHPALAERLRAALIEDVKGILSVLGEVSAMGTESEFTVVKNVDVQLQPDGWAEATLETCEKRSTVSKIIQSASSEQFAAVRQLAIDDSGDAMFVAVQRDPVARNVVDKQFGGDVEAAVRSMYDNEAALLPTISDLLKSVNAALSANDKLASQTPRAASQPPSASKSSPENLRQPVFPDEVNELAREGQISGADRLQPADVDQPQSSRDDPYADCHVIHSPEGPLNLATDDIRSSRSATPRPSHGFATIVIEHNDIPWMLPIVTEKPLDEGFQALQRIVTEVAVLSSAPPTQISTIAPEERNLGGAPLEVGVCSSAALCGELAAQRSVFATFRVDADQVSAPAQARTIGSASSDAPPVVANVWQRGAPTLREATGETPAAECAPADSAAIATAVGPDVDQASERPRITHEALLALEQPGFDELKTLSPNEFSQKAAESGGAPAVVDSQKLEKSLSMLSDRGDHADRDTDGANNGHDVAGVRAVAIETSLASSGPAEVAAASASPHADENHDGETGSATSRAATALPPLSPSTRSRSSSSINAGQNHSHSPVSPTATRSSPPRRNGPAATQPFSEALEQRRSQSRLRGRSSSPSRTPGAAAAPPGTTSDDFRLFGFSRADEGGGRGDRAAVPVSLLNPEMHEPALSECIRTMLQLNREYDGILDEASAHDVVAAEQQHLAQQHVVAAQAMANNIFPLDPAKRDKRRITRDATFDGEDVTVSVEWGEFVVVKQKLGLGSKAILVVHPLLAGVKVVRVSECEVLLTMTLGPSAPLDGPDAAKAAKQSRYLQPILAHRVQQVSLVCKSRENADKAVGELKKQLQRCRLDQNARVAAKLQKLFREKAAAAPQGGTSSVVSSGVASSASRRRRHEASQH